jgi:hypothetical protein
MFRHLPFVTLSNENRVSFLFFLKIAVRLGVSSGRHAVEIRAFLTDTLCKFRHFHFPEARTFCRRPPDCYAKYGISPVFAAFRRFRRPGEGFDTSHWQASARPHFCPKHRDFCAMP